MSSKNEPVTTSSTTSNTTTTKTSDYEASKTPENKAEGGEFKCAECSNTFKDEGTLRRHAEDIHGSRL
jgi:uncharacterized Zn-finger protein